jgi:hypothetical protein
MKLHNSIQRMKNCFFIHQPTQTQTLTPSSSKHYAFDYTSVKQTQWKDTLLYILKMMVVYTPNSVGCW